MTQDQGEDCSHSPDGPQTCSSRVDSASGFPPLSHPKTICSHMDHCTPDNLHLEVLDAPVSTPL